MLQHKYTEPTEINFAKLEERLMQINSEKMFTQFQFLHNFWWPMTNSNGFKKSTLIKATGGSKAAAYYLQMVLESKGTITEVIEPRDYFYKKNINNFDSFSDDRMLELSGIKQFSNNYCYGYWFNW